MNRIHKQSGWLLCAVLIVWLLSGCRAAPRTDTLEIHMLDVGNADCFLIKQGTHAMLIDGGDPEDADHIVSYLHTHGVERLEAIVMSHPHADHIGSLTRVIQAYRTDTLYFAAIPQGLEAITPLHTRLFDAAQKRQTAICQTSDGTSFSLGAAHVEIYPLAVTSEDANDYSLFVRVTFGVERVLFTGDATEKAHRALLDSAADITATILKVSHHGGKIDTTRAFLKAVQPKAALISCGAENLYGHPHTDTLSALKEQGIVYYRTDLSGDVILTLDGDTERFIETTR